VSADKPLLPDSAAGANPFSWACSELDLCAAAAAPQRRDVVVACGGKVNGETHRDGGAVRNRCQQTSFMRAKIAIQAIQCPRTVGTDGAQRRRGIPLRQQGKISPQSRDRPLPRGRVEVWRARRHE
jgi:hypothetical protein